MVAQPYVVIADNWEGRPAELWDIPLLKANGVEGLIVRLNDMNGGHHMDAEFVDNWSIAKTFPVYSLYFVYNPWVSGQANYQWLSEHLPNDAPLRLFFDIEVRKPDYPPATYASEVEKFINFSIAGGWRPTIYTGAWFLPYLSYWLKTVQYWWAAYSLALTACTNWQSYRSVLSTLNYANWVKNAPPGTAPLWQATGDKCFMQGFGGKDVDINIRPGTLEEAIAWFGIPETVPPVIPPTVQEQIDELKIRIEVLELQTHSHQNLPIVLNGG